MDASSVYSIIIIKWLILNVQSIVLNKKINNTWVDNFTVEYNFAPVLKDVKIAIRRVKFVFSRYLRRSNWSNLGDSFSNLEWEVIFYYCLHMQIFVNGIKLKHSNTLVVEPNVIYRYVHVHGSYLHTWAEGGGRISTPQPVWKKLRGWWWSGLFRKQGFFGLFKLLFESSGLFKCFWAFSQNFFLINRFLNLKT